MFACVRYVRVWVFVDVDVLVSLREARQFSICSPKINLVEIIKMGSTVQTLCGLVVNEINNYHT